MLFYILLCLTLNPPGVISTNDTSIEYFSKDRGFSANNSGKTSFLTNAYISNQNLIYSNINTSLVGLLNYYNSNSVSINAYIIYINGSIFTSSNSYYDNFLTTNFINITYPFDFEVSGDEVNFIEQMNDYENVTISYGNNTIDGTTGENGNILYENTESTLLQIFRRAITSINEQRQFQIYPFYHLKVKSARM